VDNTLTQYQARITTKYTVLPSESKKRSKARKKEGKSSQQDDKSKSDIAVARRRGRFTIKTHDTASAVTLVHHTNKASDLGLVMRNLGGLGADMAGMARSTAAATSSSVLVDPRAGTETPKEEQVAGPSVGAAAASGDKAGDSKSKKKKKGKGKK